MIFPLFVPAGYASTFYRFKYFFSFLKKREPQIVADVPHRLSPGKKLPVLIIFRNGDYYPARIEQIEVRIDGRQAHQSRPNLRLEKSYQEIMLHIDRSGFAAGPHRIDVLISYDLGSKKKRCINDNYRGTKKEALPCYFSAEPLPRFANFFHGDGHSHSNYTDDQIEFGASPGSAKTMAAAIGLDFFCITDHSYDLDNLPGNFLKNDPQLRHWRQFRKEIAELNRQGGCMIIPGEEVSVRNGNQENVHLLVLNEASYLPGSGDSGERWLHFHSELDIAEACTRCGPDSLLFAAHPAEKAPLLHRILLNRGDWKTSDIAPDFCGVQIFNGHGRSRLSQETAFWTKLLLQGRRLFALAGNDAHGNFGRNRYIRFPFVKIAESYTQLFGCWRTDIFLPQGMTGVPALMYALKSGCYSLSNGPALDMQVVNSKGHSQSMGGAIQEPKTVKVRLKSSIEFGKLTSCIIYFGPTGAVRETILLEKTFDHPQLFEASIEYNMDTKPETGYIRAVATSQTGNNEYFVFSNPVWIK